MEEESKSPSASPSGRYDMFNTAAADSEQKEASTSGSPSLSKSNGRSAANIDTSGGDDLGEKSSMMDEKQQPSLQGTLSGGMGVVIDLNDKTGFDEHEDFGNPVDDYKPERKQVNFEFTSNLGMFRVIRLMLYIQTIELIIDSPTVKVPSVFFVFCSSICHYSLRFYSRPFLDVIYICQKFIGNDMIELFEKLSGDASEAAELQIDDSTPWRRQLEEREEPIINFLDLRTWHVMKYFTHFFCSIMFCVLAVTFTFYFWEIQDFTDRNILRTWIKQYVADGWWMRGGVHIMVILAKACFIISFLAMFIYIFARQFNGDSFPTGTAVVGTCIICSSIIVVLTIIGCNLIGSAEVAFTRYVSQNVGYTSTMILKRVVKAKIEIGLLLMFIMYVPALYIFSQTLILVTDWNDSLATSYRVLSNFDVPCYLLAFPPFKDRKTQESGFQCAMSEFISPAENVRASGYYEDANYVQCDSYYGILFFILGVVCCTFLIVSYGYIFWRLISETEMHYKQSRWVKPLYAVQDIYKAELRDYQNSYPLTYRTLLAIRAALLAQYRYAEEGGSFCVSCLGSSVSSIINTALCPIYCVCAPFAFLGSRLFIILCNDFTKEGRQRKLVDELRKKQMDMTQDVIDIDESGGHSELNFEMENSQDRELNEQLEEDMDQMKSNAQIMGAALVNMDERIFGGGRAKARNILHDCYSYFDFGTYIAYLKVHWIFMIRFFMCKKQESIAFHHLPGSKLADWRTNFLISTKEKRLRDLKVQIVGEVSQSKHEFVTDHELQISVFDRVMDSGGTFMLICPYDFYLMKWTMLLWMEITAYATLAALTKPFWTWQSRGLLICLICIGFMTLTYVFSPYTEEADKWYDFMGRMMVVITYLGLYVISVMKGDDYKPKHTSIFTVYESVGELSNIDFFGEDFDILIDVAMSVYFYFYIVNIMASLGAFGYWRRKVESLKFGMHDHILNFLVHKADERTFGCENIYTGLELLQQWDDIIARQRRYALLAWPDVRPSHLVGFQQKIVEIGWSALFNLNIKNIRSSVGLTFLHTTMCTADAETSRWIMHKHPELLNVEDSQRDTPLTIALKECSYFLVIYSTLNDGNLDDGTTYSDNGFFDHFPEVLTTREDIYSNGEYIVDQGVKYILQQVELNFLLKHGYYLDRPPEPKKKKKLGKRKQIKPKKVKVANKPLPSRRKKGGKGAKKVIDASLFVQRFPEDDVYDDYEGGQMGAWNILGLNVPLETIQINEYNKDEALNEDEIDLKKVIKNLQKIDTKITDVIPKDDPFVAEMENFDDGFLRGVGLETVKKKKKKMNLVRMIHDVKSIILSGTQMAGSIYSLVAGQGSKLKQGEVRYKMCQYADILLSREISGCLKNYHWNTDAYLEFNRLSSKIQGEVAQQLAYACNFQPPEGFARMSNWTKNGAPVEYDEYDGLHGDEHLEGLVNAFKFASKVGTYISKPIANFTSILNKKKSNDSQDNEFNDRIVSFLADCLVSCRERLDICDSELSGPSRIGYRAVMRALRRRHCSFIIPGIFVPPRRIIIRHLEMRQNELDCGDAILLADALIMQQSVVLIDISENRIGARGMIALCRILKTHESIVTFKIDKNRIGPGAGKEIGILLKSSSNLKVLSLAKNRMGDLIRYPYPQQREQMDSAARDIFWGLKMNKTLQVLDLSYNNLGSKVAEVLTQSIIKHPTLFSLNLSGNDLGRQGAIMIWSMAGVGGNVKSIFKEKDIAEGSELVVPGKQAAGGENAGIVESSASVIEEGSSSVLIQESSALPGSTQELGASTTKSKSNKNKFVNLAYLGLADNQLPPATGKALKLLLKNNKKITALDLSGNCIGFEGGLEIAQELESIYGVEARDAKKKFYDEMTSKNFKRKGKKKIIYTSLMSLNLKRNGIGPAVISSLAQCLCLPNCTITDLDVSDNPLFYTAENSGKADIAGVDIRSGLGKNYSLVKLNIANNGFLPPEVVPILGGLAKNVYMTALNLQGTILDETSCLQLSNALSSSKYLSSIQLRDCKMGPKGGGLVLVMVEQIRSRLTKVDIAGNDIGSYSIIPLSRALTKSDCAIVTLDVSRNLLERDGGTYMAKALVKNGRVTDLDMSSNALTSSVAECISDALRGLYENGRKIQDTVIRKIVLSNNPDIGPLGAKVLMLAVANETTEHIEFSNIGGGPQVAKIVAQYLKKVTVPWYHVDISNNDSYRGGLNPIFWSLRHNNRLRVLKLANNKAGSLFGTDDDSIGIHGISIDRALTENTLLTHFDLSYNNMSTEAGSYIIDAIRQNETIRHVNLAGNLFDEGISEKLADFLKENDIVMDLDLSHNKLGFACGLAIAEGMIVNRSIRRLNIGRNRIASAGIATRDSFYQFLCMNYSLRTLIIAGNRLGHEWGCKIAEGLSRNSTLTKVDMRNTRISVEAGRALHNVFVHKKSLMELGISFDEVGVDTFDKMRRVYQTKKAFIFPTDMKYETTISEERHGHSLKNYDHHNEQQDFSHGEL